MAMRMKKREEWDAFWKIYDLETRGRLTRVKFLVWRAVDWPATFWRENVVERLRDKYGYWPYYHRRYKRVPTIDECHVNDKVCYHEAQMQFRLDKLVDNKILQILMGRRDNCLRYHNKNMVKCQQQMEDYEEAELNWYIKYGDLGTAGDVLSAYMKQKHRMIWERRNPEILAERQKLYEEHKAQLANGIYDHWFWKRGPWFNYKEHREGEFNRVNVQPYTADRVKDPEGVSVDPEYYRKRSEDEKAGKVKLASPFEAFP